MQNDTTLKINVNLSLIKANGHEGT